MTEYIKIPWGQWDLETGAWQHNHLLSKSEEEQHEANVKNGYSCKCGYILTQCKCKEHMKNWMRNRL